MFLPDPTSPLSSVVPSSTIEAVNRSVENVLDDKEDQSIQKGTRGHYETFSAKEKASVARCAAEIGVTKAIRKLEKQYPGRQLKESTVRAWVKRYKFELKEQCKTETMDGTPINELENKRRGRPLLLGKELDDQVKAYILTMRDKGAVINSAIVTACASGVVKKHDANLLKCNGGHIEFTKHWASNFLERLGFVKRKASTSAKVSVSDFEERKAQFLFDIKTIIDMEKVPSELVINWDHTGLHYVPVSNWTMAKEGAKRVEIAGLGDKRQLTAVFAGTMNVFFPPSSNNIPGENGKMLT